jgi:hypothetical protein
VSNRLLPVRATPGTRRAARRDGRPQIDRRSRWSRTRERGHPDDEQPDLAPPRIGGIHSIQTWNPRPGPAGTGPRSSRASAGRRRRSRSRARQRRSRRARTRRRRSRLRAAGSESRVLRVAPADSSLPRGTHSCMPSRTLLLSAALAFGLGACAPQPRPALPRRAHRAPLGACPAAPAVADDLPGWGPPRPLPRSSPCSSTARASSSAARIASVHDGRLDGRPIGAPDRTASIAIYDLGRDASKPIATLDGTIHLGDRGQRRHLRPEHVPFPTPGATAPSSRRPPPVARRSPFE